MSNKNIEKVVVTPISNIKFSLKCSINARDRRAMTKDLLDNMEIGEDLQAKPKIGSDAINKSQDATIQTILIKIEYPDGVVIEGDKILDGALDLSVNDFDFLIAEINIVTGTGEKVAKK